MSEISNRRFKRKTLPFFIGLALCNHGVFAQESEAEGASGDGQDAALVEEVVVTGIRASQAAAIDIKRESANVVDSIVAEDIGKLPDTTITDSLQRVTGVQITREAGEGTSLNIRGMPQVLTTMNGEQFLSPWSITGVQANYSDIPAGMIAGVDVYKSQSADIQSGGISGVVDLKTLDPKSLESGFTSRLRLEGGMGSRSQDSDADPDPDYGATLVLGYNTGDKFAVVGSLYGASTYAANYSIWEEQRLAFLDGQGGTPRDPLDLDGDGDVVNDWYIVPSEYGAKSSFVDRERTGASITATYDFNENWSVRGDLFYTRMDQYERSVKAGFNGKHTPNSFDQNGESAAEQQEVYDVLQAEGTEVGHGAYVTFNDVAGHEQTRELHTLHVANIWAADFQTTSSNEITQQPPAKAGGLALRTESPDTGRRPVYSSARKLSSTFGSKWCSK